MRLASLLLLATTACSANLPATRPAPRPSSPEPLAQPVVTLPTPTPTPEQLALAPTQHPVEMTEVLLDPRGNAAIALDTRGGAHLWPDLGGAPEPVTLPLIEAAWVALAATSERRFVVAAIDTAGATRVGEVALEASGARWQTLFELPATDPLLEIHVLDGGARMLALGLDHRLRLYDRQGKAVSIVDTPSFIPWQLRIAHHIDRPPTIVAVLAGPVRAQPITLSDDTLSISGVARQVTLDQGPNHNDLALSPDGSFVTALRRPRAEGRAWYLERIDLASGERRWLAGEVDTKVRPRLHLVDATRVLLESGSGKGFWVDLSQARLPPAGAPFDRKQLPRTPTRVVDLPGSTEDTRMWSTVTAGVRVVAERTTLLVDPLSSDEHLRFAAESFRPRDVALDATGERIAWIHSDHLLVETLGEPGPPRKIAELGRAVKLLVFVDPTRLLLVDDRGELTLRAFDDGAPRGQLKAASSWINAAHYQASGEHSGRVVIFPKRDAEPSVVVPVDANGLGAHHKLTDADRATWPELGMMPGEHQRLEARLRASTGDKTLEIQRISSAEDRRYLITSGPSRHLYQLRGEQVQHVEILRQEDLWLTPAPRAPRIAAIHDTADRFQVLSMLDFSGDAPRKLWSRALPPFTTGVRWSADGSRLGIAADGAQVLDASTGAVLLERHHLGLTVQRLPDSKKRG